VGPEKIIMPGFKPRPVRPAAQLYVLHCPSSPEKSLRFFRYSNPCPSGPQHSCTCYTVPAPQKNPYASSGIRTPVHPARSTVVRATLSQLPRKILTPLTVIEPLPVRLAAHSLYKLHCPSSLLTVEMASLSNQSDCS